MIRWNYILNQIISDYDGQTVKVVSYAGFNVYTVIGKPSKTNGYGNYIRLKNGYIQYQISAGYLREIRKNNKIKFKNNLEKFLYNLNKKGICINYIRKIASKRGLNL